MRDEGIFRWINIATGYRNRYRFRTQQLGLLFDTDTDADSDGECKMQYFFAQLAKRKIIICDKLII